MFRTANSRFEAVGFELDLQVAGIDTTSVVYFFRDESIEKNVLGRRGWLDRVKAGIVDYDRMLYLGAYGDE